MEDKVYRIKYKDGNGQVSERDISKIKVDGMRMHAHCHMRGGERTFWIDQIIDATDRGTGEVANPYYIGDENSTQGPAPQFETGGELYYPWGLLAAFNTGMSLGGYENFKNALFIANNVDKMGEQYISHLIETIDKRIEARRAADEWVSWDTERLARFLKGEAKAHPKKWKMPSELGSIEVDGEPYNPRELLRMFDTADFKNVFLVMDNVGKMDEKYLAEIVVLLTEGTRLWSKNKYFAYHLALPYLSDPQKLIALFDLNDPKHLYVLLGFIGDMAESGIDIGLLIVHIREQGMARIANKIKAELKGVAKSTLRNRATYSWRVQKDDEGYGPGSAEPATEPTDAEKALKRVTDFLEKEEAEKPTKKTKERPENPPKRREVTMMEAGRHLGAITIEYRGADGNLTKRDISEIKIFGHQIQARCHLRDEERTFNICRISSAANKDTGEAVSLCELIDCSGADAVKAAVKKRKISSESGRIEINGEMYNPPELLTTFDPGYSEGISVIVSNVGKMDEKYLAHVVVSLTKEDRSWAQNLGLAYLLAWPRMSGPEKMIDFFDFNNASHINAISVFICQMKDSDRWPFRQELVRALIEKGMGNVVWNFGGPDPTPPQKNPLSITDGEVYVRRGD